MPIQQTIYVRKSSRQIDQILGLLPDYASGQKGGALSWPQILQVRIGLAALGRIKQAFIVKSRGGTDETGLRWPPLSPATIAYSRRNVYHELSKKTGKWTQKWVPKGASRASKRPSWALMPKERTRWWMLYAKFLAIYRGNKAHAAAVAWKILKHEGAKTLMELFGGLTVDILRDIGLLFNSLSPGATVGDPPPPQYPPKPKHQVFRTRRGEVIVGTNRKWAWTHHNGTRRIPQRRLWPDPKSWTDSWWKDMLTQARLGVIDIVTYLLSKP